jgi:hypothetical protein
LGLFQHRVFVFFLSFPFVLLHRCVFFFFARSIDVYKWEHIFLEWLHADAQLRICAQLKTLSFLCVFAHICVITHMRAYMCNWISIFFLGKLHVHAHLPICTQLKIFVIWLYILFGKPLGITTWVSGKIVNLCSGVEKL